jgi:hypothetical protein
MTRYGHIASLDAPFASVKLARRETAETESAVSILIDRGDGCFDDVKVPWERLFVHRDTDMCRAQFHDTQEHAARRGLRGAPPGAPMPAARKRGRPHTS